MYFARIANHSRRLGPCISNLLTSEQGNVATIFAIALLPLILAVGGAVDYSSANSVRTDMQKSLDSVALRMVKTAADAQSDALAADAKSFFTAVFNRPNAESIQVSAQYDSGTGILALTSSADVKTSLMNIIGLPYINVTAVSKAKLGGSRTWQVCVLVTHPDAGHTLLVKNQASIDFHNCMVQVNTENWDAVEARDTSYIHSVNGVNCFTGDIHYGDVTPPKEPTCTMLPDPYESFTLPAAASVCDFPKQTINTTTTLNPGTYCGGLNITAAEVTFNPGLYVIKDGEFKVQNTKTITAPGVTFVLSGKNASLDIDMSKYGGTFNITPNTSSAAGQYAGFLFFLDQTPDSSGKKSKGDKSYLSGVTMKSNGIIYLRGQALNLNDGSDITLDTGSIIADYILPDDGKLNLHGTVNSPTAAMGMKKSIASNTPALLQ